jgi:hypothetical protein
LDVKLIFQTYWQTVQGAQGLAVRYKVCIQCLGGSNCLIEEYLMKAIDLFSHQDRYGLCLRRELNSYHLMGNSRSVAECLGDLD